MIPLLVASLLLATAACGLPTGDPPDDEAMLRARHAGKTPEVAAREWFYPKAIYDYFPGMDKIVVMPAGAPSNGPIDPLQAPVYQLMDKQAPSSVLVDPLQTPNEILGRNAWMLWCAGNEGFWDWLGREFGFIDLLKVLDTRTRSRRFRDAGLINEPGMQQAGSPSPDEFGLWLDQPADPGQRVWRAAYVKRAFGMLRSQDDRGQAYGAPNDYGAAAQYDPRIPPPEIYGLSSGVVGLRLFPNPNFDAAAQAKWNAAAYYDNARGDPNLVRPYRVGMSCAFCHASFHPLSPPRDETNPEWANISGNIGAQYLRVRAVFGNLLPKSNFVYHLLDSQPPGTIDTSLIASDNINNPNAMNPVFNLPQRALVSFRNPKEKLSGPAAALPALWRHPEASPAAGADDVVPDNWRKVFASQTPDLSSELHASNDAQRRVPRILFDGADSIGAWGALARVYLNIGTYYEQWNRLHRAVVGFQPQKPFTIDTVAKHSVYWHATQLRVGALRDYFLKVTPPMPLVEARAKPDSTDPATLATEHEARLRRIDVSKLPRGRKVFARNCIVCHSSIQPAARHEDMMRMAALGEYWDHDPGRWLRDAGYVDWAEKAVETEPFWRGNYLATDYRIPVNVVGTNACRGMATNAVTGNMWEDFSSESYRHMPSIGTVAFFNPFIGDEGGDDRFVPRHRTASGVPAGGGGPGFYRVPTLVSIWATAPFLHNNSLGVFTNDPSVDGRLRAFDDGIRKLLWPQRRLESSSYNEATPSRLRSDRGLIWRTTEDTYLNLPAAYVPGVLGSQSALVRGLQYRFPYVRTLSARWWPVPSAVLLLLALAVLLWASNFLVRAIGYVAIVLALVVGILVYFLNGALGELRIGPIPKGTPVNLLANVNPDAPPKDLKRVLAVTRDVLTEIESSKADATRTRQLLRERIAPELIKVSKCPDLVMTRGHYFEWFRTMSDADKEALIELLKTF